MLGKIGRLFIIKTRWEAFLIIYALALGAVERGSVYLTRFPGWGGDLLFLACTGAVFMAGGKILDCLKHEQALAAAKASVDGDASKI
ncbi:membrane protein [Novosphingobium barchaimii]|nr:membrane protein [Novosphingobium barchaimii]